MRAPLAAPHQIQVNQALNPNVETTLNGWASNGGLLYPVSRDTSAPISGTASCMTTRSPNILTQGANGTFEGGVTTGWSSFATHAADAAIKRTGSHSLKITYAAAASGQGATANVTGLTIGTGYTVEGWVYVPAASAGSLPCVRMSAVGTPSAVQPVSTYDTWVYSMQTWTATATSHQVFLATGGPTTAGMVAYYDDIKVYLTPVTGVAGSVYNSGGLSSSLNQFPVTPGVPVTWSFDVKTLETGRRAQITIPWRDAANVAISGTPSSGFVDLTPGRVGRVTLTAIPPVGAAFCYATIAIYTVTGNALAGELCWFDNCYAGSDPSGAYFDGSSPGGSWNGTVNQSSSTRLSELVNLCDTPTCDDGLAGGWTTALPARYPVTADSTAPISGTFSAMVTRTADTPNAYLGSCTLRRRDLLRFPVVAGRSVTSSFDFRVELANRRVQVNTTFYDSAGAIIGSGSNWVQHLATGAVAGQVYRLITTSALAPANAATVIFSVEVLAMTGNTIAGERCWFDNVRISDNGESAYLDGGSPGCVWAGTPHASASVRVGDYNRAENPNLESVLTGWYTNDGNRYAVTRDLTAPISGVASALGTRVYPNKVTGGANGTFEGGVITNWGLNGGGPGATMTADATIKRTGSHSLKTTFGTITAVNGGAASNITGLVIGYIYTVEAWLYVPADSLGIRPAVRVSGVASGNEVTTPDVWTLSSMTFTATATSHLIYAPVNMGSAVAGQACYADDVKVYLTPTNTALSGYLTGNMTGTITFPAQPGVPITWAIDIRAERSARRATFGMGFRNASNTNIGSSPNAIADMTAGQVYRLVATGLPPAAAAICYGSLIVTCLDGMAVENERIWMDNMYIGTDPAGAYFDGSSPGCQWAGTPNQSASFRPLVHPYNQWNGSQLVPLDGAWLTADESGLLVPAGFAEVEVV